MDATDACQAREIVERIADAVDAGGLVAPAGWSTSARAFAAQMLHSMTRS